MGFVIGLLIGYSIDQGRPMATSRQLNNAFFEACFLTMGFIAKADGQVSEKEVQYARHVMNQLHLSESKTQEAIRLFYRGKHDDFNHDAVFNNFREQAGTRRRVLAQFINIQVKLAYANGAINSQMKTVLQDVATKVGLGRLNFTYYDLMFGWQAHFEQGGQGARFQEHFKQPFHEQYSQSVQRKRYSSSLKEAYEILGVNAKSSKQDVKRAYRKLMSQYHPDKLMSKGLSEEEMQKATEKAQKIKSAYEQICDYNQD